MRSEYPVERPPRWLRRLAAFGARRGWPRAQVTLGAILEREPPINVNLSRANELYRQAAENGSAQAMWNLGVNHLGTKGGKRNPEEALYWLGLELLERAGREGCRPAIEALVTLYREGGEGIAPNRARARHWSMRLLPWHQRFLHRFRAEPGDLGGKGA